MKHQRTRTRPPFHMRFRRDVSRGPHIWTLTVAWSPIANWMPGTRAYAHGIDIMLRNPVSWWKY